MTLTRQAVLEKLDGFLKKDISAEKIYEWALFVAVSSEYEMLAKEDPVIGMTIQAMITLNHRNPAQVVRLEDLQLFRQYLAEGRQMVPEPVPVFEAPVEVHHSEEKEQEKKKRFASKRESGSIVTLRIYVVIFGICSLIVNLMSVIKPEWLHLSATVPSSFQVLSESWMHISYALLLIMPLPTVARGPLFLPALPLFVFGMIYYWYVSVMLVSKLSLSIIFFMAIIPFSALPATLALILLVMDWIEGRDEPTPVNLRRIPRL